MLPDYLQPGLDVVFVGFNPSLRSARIGHYYAGRGNQFWPFLFEAGFTDRQLRPEEDACVPGFGVGLTDLVARPTRGIGELGPEEYRAGVGVLRRKIARFRPVFVCFNGKTGYARAVNRACVYGPQEDRLEGARVYVAPSTSGALPMRREDKLAHYRALRTLLDGG